ncbi:MAG: hypothetical protein ACLP3R_05400 [Candidatus Korobacteraceae bacterium]|jgi:hypothetical protein
MSNSNRSANELYSEVETAAAVGISIARLHALLDKYVFTGQHRRPEPIEFTSSDLLLLSYWNTCSSPATGDNVIAMPQRK